MLQGLQSCKHTGREDIREEEKRAVRQARDRTVLGRSDNVIHLEQSTTSLWDAHILCLTAWQGRDTEEDGVNTTAGEAYPAETEARGL